MKGSSRRRATYGLVQGEAQAAMLVQHKESPLPFLSERGDISAAESSAQCAFHRMNQFYRSIFRELGVSVRAQPSANQKGSYRRRFICRQFTTQPRVTATNPSCKFGEIQGQSARWKPIVASLTEKKKPKTQRSLFFIQMGSGILT